MVDSETDSESAEDTSSAEEVDESSSVFNDIDENATDNVILENLPNQGVPKLSFKKPRRKC